MDTILPTCQKQIFRHWEAFCLSSSVQVLTLYVTTPRDSYVWNYRVLVILLTLSESFAEGGLEPLTIWSMREKLATEVSLHLSFHHDTYLLVSELKS